MVSKRCSGAIVSWNGFGSYPLRKDYPLRGVGEREDYKIVTRESV